MQQILNKQENLSIMEGSAFDIALEDGKIAGVELQDGTKIKCNNVILTTGTFLNGEIHIGNSIALSNAIQANILIIQV
jgi:tRNA uridine 5-carboxymethylaminomethyl modification enzyme